MDFDLAVNKLERNHSKSIRRSQARRTQQRSSEFIKKEIKVNGDRGRTSTNALTPSTSSSSSLPDQYYARKEAERRREEARQRDEERKRRIRRAHAYFRRCEEDMGVVQSLVWSSSSSSSNDKNKLPIRGGEKSTPNITNNSQNQTLFWPTSIHGEGDKIALPVSVLQTIMDHETAIFNAKRQTALMQGQGSSLIVPPPSEEPRSSPYEFRVGIPNPLYKFPASKRMQELSPSEEEEEDDTMDVDEDDDDDDDDDNVEEARMAYLDELSQKYLSYTYCTVVEFTQEEGHVGLPASVARVLCKDDDDGDEAIRIPLKTTVDPSGESSTNGESLDATPGHLAWGAFPVPDTGVELTMVHLPKGKGCTLIPTDEAIRKGFYGLKDMKAALEQSLIRTRATLSIHDTVHCWHRGTRFELSVSSVTPKTFGAVSCINTDIEVEFGEPASSNAVTTPVEDGTPSSTSTTTGGGRTLGGNTTSTPMDNDINEEPSTIGGGRTLSGEPTVAASSNGRTLGSLSTVNTVTTTAKATSTSLLTPTVSTATSTTMTTRRPLLPKEPAANERVNVCDVLIRGYNGQTGRRRFHVRDHTVTDLYAFAATVVHEGNEDKAETEPLVSTTPFRLVTRFPRKVVTGGDDTSLETAGVREGQELLLVEKL